MTTLKWKTFEANWADISDSNKVVLAQRGFTHLFGNEVASRITTMRKAGKVSAAEAGEAEDKARAELLERVLNGDLTMRAAGDELGAETRRIAIKQANKEKPAAMKVIEWAKSAQFKAAVEKWSKHPAVIARAEANVADLDLDVEV